MDNPIFAKAVGLVRSGKKSEARALFQELLKADRANEMAWLWYVECVDTPAERIQALEMCVRFNPQAQRVRLSLSALRRANPTMIDLGRTQPIFINQDREERAGKRTPPFTVEDEWILSAGSAIFTVPPEQIPPEEFARIEARTEAFLLKNPDLKPVWRRSI